MIFKYFHSKFFRLFHEEKQTTLQNTQRYLDEIGKSFSIYKPDIFGFYEVKSYNDSKKMGLYLGSLMGLNTVKNKHLSSLNCWHEYENNPDNGEQAPIQIIDLLQNNQRKIGELRGRPTIAYLAAVNRHSDFISIVDEDLAAILNITKNIDEKIREIDVILHSNGGYMEAAFSIIEFLRQRFDKVTFLIPLTARSSATLMAMSGDEIVMTPESCLGPYDVQMSIKDGKITLPALEMKRFMRTAQWAHMRINIFASKDFYQGIDAGMAYRAILDSDRFVKRAQKYAYDWLMKYMFKAHSKNQIKSFQDLLLWLKNYIFYSYKARRIVSFFTNTKIHISHTHPIMYPAIQDSGLNVSVAEGEFLELLRETYHLADRLFERSPINKIFLNKDIHTYRFTKNDQNVSSEEQ